jgi:ATP-dependent Clp protease ATP-binding subunit ClpA
MKLLLIPFLMLALSFNAFADSRPDFRKLQEIARIIHSEDAAFPTDKGWEKITGLMNNLDIFDESVKRMMSTLCSDEPNKSVLIVGEPSDTFKYMYARLAMMGPEEGCKRLSHMDLKIAKLQGYMYVGTTERNWRDFIEKPAYNKDVVLYINNLALLIGIGTSMNRDVGIESTYINAVKTGKLKTVAFLNKYDYKRLIHGRHAYVLNGFQETINVDDLKMAQVDKLVRSYINLNAPHIKMSDKVANFMYRNIQYYQPNIMEPQRTMNVVLSLIRQNPMKTTRFRTDIKSADPYNSNSKQEFIVDRPNAKAIQLSFEYFQTEKGRDRLRIYDFHTNTHLQDLTGKLGKTRSESFDTNKLRMEFLTDGSVVDKGFKIDSILEQKVADITLTITQVRQAIMEMVQVPEWIIKRDYSVVRDLPGLLDGDVVGIHMAKKAVIKAFKVGYVAGRTDEKPAGALLLVGPTGTGKSYIAKKAAEFMDMKIIVLDMTQYATAESFDRFLDTVANNLILYPYAVYLFEEIDKADTRVLDRLFFMMDEGIFYDKNQRPLFARGSMVMMTTNAGHDLIVRERNNPNLQRLVNLELQKFYRPSFLNRFDSIPIFLPFSKAEFHQLATIMTSKKIKKMKEYFDWNATVDEEVIKFMGENGGSDLYGARPMERMVENVISVGISEYQITRGTIEFGDSFKISKVRGEKFKFNISVNGRGGMSYEVDMDNNSGLIEFSATFPELAKLFNDSRMY